MDKQRIPVYVTPEERQALRVAAAYAGLSLTEYVKGAALEAARRQEHERNSDARPDEPPPGA